MVSTATRAVLEVERLGLVVLEVERLVQGVGGGQRGRVSLG
ncbi:hypothetical protein [Dactylosporangium fulvum]|uniref:Uncharacterized protein n=1 Tax=Dactylosporangium fulvum TaxID=53359 RepID=A0ABY5VV25_9ACTN|nr:hypothetical protein [Dactylosporangium fulvum]UWP81057.1 hypothetical protein Dfulv_38980 [Dactylosporangium fulvum]